MCRCPSLSRSDRSADTACEELVIYRSGDPLEMESQEDMLRFCDRHNAVSGTDVYIYGSDGTEALSCLCAVSGSMFFEASHLRAIRRLNNLRKVGGFLSLGNNEPEPVSDLNY